MIIFQGRIQNFSQEGVPIPRGSPTQYFDNISEKPYKIKEILARRGGRALGAAP